MKYKFIVHTNGKPYIAIEGDDLPLLIAMVHRSLDISGVSINLFEQLVTGTIALGGNKIFDTPDYSVRVEYEKPDPINAISAFIYENNNVSSISSTDPINLSNSLIYLINDDLRKFYGLSSRECLYHLVRRTDHLCLERGDLKTEIYFEYK